MGSRHGGIKLVTRVNRVNGVSRRQAKDGADLVVASRYHGDMVSFWRGRPWRINPARIPIACAICGRTVMRARSRAFSQGQRTSTCSRTCRDLLAMLSPLRDRAAFASTGR